MDDLNKNISELHLSDIIKIIPVILDIYATNTLLLTKITNIENKFTALSDNYNNLNNKYRQVISYLNGDNFNKISLHINELKLCDNLSKNDIIAELYNQYDSFLNNHIINTKAPDTCEDKDDEDDEDEEEDEEDEDDEEDEEQEEEDKDEEEEEEEEEEQNEEEEEEEEEKEAFEILINNKKFYATDVSNSNVYIINEDFSIGDIVGILSNGIFIVNNI